MANVQDLLNLLKEKGVTLGSVESMTAGLFGATVCSVPGASEVYKGGLITYCADLKTRLANVDSETIEEEGVVSARVAADMAIGGKETLGVDVCISVTGNAGPTAEEGKAEVGQIYLGLAYEESVWTLPLKFSLERNELRKAAVDAMVSFVVSLFPPVREEK